MFVLYMFSRSIIDSSRSIIDDSREMLILAASFTIIILLEHRPQAQELDGKF
jgi:hypothetical protein